MTDTSIYELISFSLRIFFVISVPLLAAMVLASLVVGLLQAASGVQEKTIQYAARLVVFVVLAYLFFPLVASYLSEVFLLAYNI